MSWPPTGDFDSMSTPTPEGARFESPHCPTAGGGRGCRFRRRRSSPRSSARSAATRWRPYRDSTASPPPPRVAPASARKTGKERGGLASTCTSPSPCRIRTRNRRAASSRMRRTPPAPRAGRARSTRASARRRRTGASSVETTESTAR